MVKRKNGDDNPPAKAPRVQAPRVQAPRVQRRWNVEEENKILAYLKDTVVTGRKINDPTAIDYTRKMLVKLKFPECSDSQLLNKIKNIKTGYTDTIEWRNQTGQGVLKEQGEMSFKEATLKRCSRFEELDEIYSEKLNINPPFLINTPLPDNTVEISEIGDEQASDLFTSPTSFPEVEPVESQPSTSTAIAVIKDTKGPDDKKNGKKKTGLEALMESRSSKTTIDNRKLDIDLMKLEFEKQKWESEMEIKKKQLEIDEKKIESEAQNSRYEIELKYKTQIEIAKLNSQTN